MDDVLDGLEELEDLVDSGKEREQVREAIRTARRADDIVDGAPALAGDEADGVDALAGVLHEDAALVLGIAVDRRRHDLLDRRVGGADKRDEVDRPAEVLEEVATD